MHIPNSEGFLELWVDGECSNQKKRIYMIDTFFWKGDLIVRSPTVAGTLVEAILSLQACLRENAATFILRLTLEDSPASIITTEA